MSLAKFSMDDEMGFLTKGMLILALVQTISSKQVLIEVGKTFNNGEPINKASQIFVRTILNGVQISYNNQLPDGYRKILATTVYFANGHGEITEVQFHNGKTIGKKFKRPWELEEILPPYEGEMNPVKFRMDIRDWLPANVTLVSASINVIDENNESTYLSYYGINNYPISLPDFYVLSRYKQVPSLT